MERRLSERVQFFQRPQADTPVAEGSFNGTSGPHDDITVGLLLDISDEGVQILTDSAIPTTETFELTIQANTDVDADLRIATMRRQWSRSDGGRIRSGFAFDGDVELIQLLDNVLDARDAGQREFRCALVSVRQTARSRALDTQRVALI